YNLTHKQNYAFSSVLFCLAILSHAFYFVFTLFVIITFVTKCKMSRLTVIICSGLSLIFGLTLILQINQILLDTIGIGASSKYTEGVWAQDNQAGGNSLIYYQIKRYWFIPFYLYFIVNYKKDFWNSIIALVGFFYFGTLSLWTISERVADLLGMLLIYNYVFSIQKVNVKLTYPILFSVLLYFSVVTIRRRKILLPENNFYYELLFPVFISLSEEQYDLNWIGHYLEGDDFRYK
ncbi:MAG: hypothetical protein K2M17_05340, partial [Bacilli bacterium]|nr:hypothetical protein [Bacilli bacterium]